MRRVLWRSWSAECAAFDLNRLRLIDLKCNWINGHVNKPEPNDVWLTGNGYCTSNDICYKATIYAEPYIYLKNEYDSFHVNNSWDVRFVYNREYLDYPKTYLLPIAGYWDYDGHAQLSRKRDHVFGMVLARKPPKLHPSDIGEMRLKYVKALSNHSFVYWGSGWDWMDQNYQGESFTSDNKFVDSQTLLSKCRFALAFDNSCLQGYLTEKFWNALAAGCIPIYYGHPSIVQTVPRDVFVYGYDFESPTEVIEYCQDMPKREYEHRLEAGRIFWAADETHSWESIFREVDRVLYDLAPYEDNKP